MTSVSKMLAIVAALLALISVATFSSGSLPRTDGKATAQAAQGIDKPASGKTIARPLRIMPLGDSITEGLQVSGGYRPLLWSLAQAAGVPIDFVGSRQGGPPSLPDRDHEGHGGEPIEGISRGVESWLKTYKPDIVLLHIGTNNIWRLDELPLQAPKRLSFLIDQITAAAPTAQVYVAGIIPSGLYETQVEQLNRAVPAIVASKVSQGKNVRFVDQHKGFTQRDLIDGIHPTTSGYLKLAEKWWAAMAADL